MGPDGHTCRLFFQDRKCFTKRKPPSPPGNWVEKFQHLAQNITMTAPFINQAAIVMFLIDGAEESPALQGSA